MFDFPNTPTSGQVITGPNGILYQWDGTKWVPQPLTAQFLPLAGGTLAGPVVQPLAPTLPTHLTNKAYVDGASSVNEGRNFFGNYNFGWGQRGSGPFNSVIGSWVYTVDRWKITTGATGDSMVATQVNLTDADRSAIGDEWAVVGLNLAAVGGSAPAGGCVVAQSLEGIRAYSGKTWTASFWAKANAPCKLGVAVDQIFGTGGSPSAPVQGAGQSINLTTSWARYSLTFTVPSYAGKTIGTNNDAQTVLNFYLSAGSGMVSRSGGVPQQTATVQLWGMQFEMGSAATPLEHSHVTKVIAECNRYYFTLPFVMAGYNLAGGSNVMPIAFPASMRGIPVITFPSTSLTNVGAPAGSAPSVTGVSIGVVTTATGPWACSGTIAASAEQ